VVDFQPLAPFQIAQNDYDLRQIWGRGAEDSIRDAYDGWYRQWDTRVEKLTNQHQARGNPYATFFHSVLAIDASGNIHLLQQESTLPDLANHLAEEGFQAAGLLDSGGSCALYDVWLGGYINHGWYFREPRGAVLVFELNIDQRLTTKS